MKKFLLSIFLLSIALGLSAAEMPQSSAVKAEHSAKIKLYAEDSDKKVIDTLSPNTHLIKIYQKGDWIKVGNPKDGAVGWVNEKQYQKTLAELNQPNIQEIFISRTTDKNNPSQDKLVVYQNGKPVSEKQAKEIYKNMKKQLEEQQKYWNTFHQNMVASQNQMLTDFLDAPFFAQPAWMPIPIVVIEKIDSANNKNNNTND